MLNGATYFVSAVGRFLEEFLVDGVVGIDRGPEIGHLPHLLG